MKKTIFLIAAALMLTVAATGCSSSSKNGDDENTTSVEQANEELDSLNDSADERIDMSIVEGTDAETADDSAAQGDVGDTVVEITDAKVIKYNDQDVIVVSYEFTNKTGEETTFEFVNTSSAYQGDETLGVATVVDVEGIECDTLGQRVPNGDTITVQKAFRLANLTDDVTITVDAASEVNETAPVSKVFKISE